MPRGVPKIFPNVTGGTYNATIPTPDLAGRSPGGIRRIHPLILIITTGGEQSCPQAVPSVADEISRNPNGPLTLDAVDPHLPETRFAGFRFTYPCNLRSRRSTARRGLKCPDHRPSRQVVRAIARDAPEARDLAILAQCRVIAGEGPWLFLARRAGR